MNFPIESKDINELGMEECEIYALYLMFEELFNDKFESIEFYQSNRKSGTTWLRKKMIYDESGFIEKTNMYEESGRIKGTILFEKSEYQIVSEELLSFGKSKVVWNFDSFGNLRNVNSNGDNYGFLYHDDKKLRQISEGFEFRWENNNISELISIKDNSIIQKVIERNQFETIVEFTGRVNKNTSGIRKYRYDELGRLIRIESNSGLQISEIEYENSGQLKKKISTNYFDGRQDSYSCVSENLINKRQILVEYLFQQREDGPISKSIVIKNKRE